MADSPSRVGGVFAVSLLAVRPNRVEGRWAVIPGYRHPPAALMFAPPVRVSLQTPAWWGPPVEGAPKPDYVLRGRVMQRDPETGEDTPRANIRVGLFYRRLLQPIDMQRSDGDGYVVFRNLMPGNQAYFGIAFDNADSPLQNSVLWDRLTAAPGP